MTCALANNMGGGKRRRMRKARKSMKGGSASGWGYVSGVVGDLNTQLNNVFGPNSHAIGNEITPISGNPNSNQSAKMRGGKRRTKGRRATRGRRTKKGGNWGNVIGQAMVPFGILGLQQTYGRRRKNNKTRRTRRH